MRKYTCLVFFGIVGAFLFSGCASTGVIKADMLKEKDKNTVDGMHIYYSITPALDTKKYTGYEDDANARAKCSTNYAMYEASKKAIENGYGFFSITFLEGSNKNPLPIVSISQIEQYCSAPFFDKESNLLDDKCSHIGLGNGSMSHLQKVKVHFYKKRNPFMPLWDAKRTLRTAKKELILRCFNGDRALLLKAENRARYN